MIDFSCPICNGETIKYNISKDKKSGRYRCKNCDRDTTFKELKTATFQEILQKINKGEENDL